MLDVRVGAEDVAEGGVGDGGGAGEGRKRREGGERWDWPVENLLLLPQHLLGV